MEISSAVNEIACDLSDVIVKCLVPVQEPSIWDKTSSIGTILAAVAAVGFGIWAEVKAIKARRRADQAEAQLRVEHAGSNIVEAFSRLGEVKELSKDDLPLREMGTHSLRDALGDSSVAARKFVHELGVFELLIVQAIEDIIGRDDDGSISSRSVELDHVQSSTIRLSAAAIRRGIRSMAFAQNESERESALERFTNATKNLSQDIRELEFWGKP